jgi:hypothetical protein
VVRYLGSAIVLEDEACFCQFEGSSVAAVTEANRRADLPFDRIVPAVLVQPTHRSGEMSISTSIPKTTGRRWSHPLAAIAAIVAVVVLVASSIVTYAINSGTRSVRSSALTHGFMLRQLSPGGREYVLGLMSLTPVELSAAFGTSPTSVPGRDRSSGSQAVRTGAQTPAAVLRSLTPKERRYVLGIASLTPVQLWAAFGTSPTPPVPHRGIGSTPAPGMTRSTALAVPILPACGPGRCWRAAGTGQPAQSER